MVIRKEFFFESETEARAVLETEAKRLRDIADKLWREYENSYTPNEYIRTKNSQKALKVGSIKRIDAITLGIEVTWDDNLAYHDSWFDKVANTKGNYKQGHSIMLISEGWGKKAEGKIYRFQYFEGINYISRVRDAFNDGKHRGISLEVQWAGEEFKKQKPQKKVLR